MQARTIRIFASFSLTFLMLATAWLGSPAVASAQQPTTVEPSPLLDLLVWDAISKQQTPPSGSPTADFVFNVTNPTDYEIVIERVQTSCGCTVAKLPNGPNKPWPLAPHTNGQMEVTVNLAGKFGTFSKAITVYSTNAQKILSVTVTMPDRPDMMRARNQQLALGDQQAVFKGECARCHVEPTRGKMGKELYATACGICHDAKPRATMVPDLHALNHDTFYGFWKFIITEGKPKSLMPAFGMQHGGPLTEEQIDSLAKVLTQTFTATPLTKTNTMPPVKSAKS